MTAYQEQGSRMTTRHIGQAAQGILEQYNQDRQRALVQYLGEAPLSLTERDALSQADEHIKTYVTQKYRRLAQVRSLPGEFLPCLYVQPIPRFPQIGGLFMPDIGMLAVTVHRQTTDILNWATLTGHERSHEAVQSRHHIYWEAGRVASSISSVGLEHVGNHRKLADGLENGLASWDQADIYHDVLKPHFPRQSAQRRETTGLFAEAIKKFEQLGLGPIAFEEIEPFMHIGDDGNVRITMGFFLMKFAQVVCRKVGNGDMQKGRDVLDRARFLGTTEGLQAVVKTFGSEVAKMIFSVDQHGGNVLGLVCKINV